MKKLKHVDLENYKKHDGKCFELKTTDGGHIALTKKCNNSKYETKIYKFSYKNSFLIPSREDCLFVGYNKTIEEAVEIHFKKLNEYINK